VLLTPGRYRRRLRGRILLVAAVAYVHGGVNRFVFLAMAQHAVLEREFPSADVTFEGPLARVGPHVTPEILRGPKSSHAESAHNLGKVDKKEDKKSVTWS